MCAAEVLVEYVCTNPAHRHLSSDRRVRQLIWHSGACGYCEGPALSVEPHRWQPTGGVPLEQLTGSRRGERR